MSATFKTCVNRTACTEDGTHCRACGRSHEEIALIRNMINQVSEFLLQMDYTNHDEFLDYLKKKVNKKIKKNRS